MDIQTRYLRYFLAVAEELSFSRAAEKLGVSQPALSQRIRDLEEAFEFPLFERNGRHVSLSEQGQALIGVARSLLCQVRQLESEVSDLRTSARSPLLVGAAMYSDFPERAQLISRFLESHPDERIELETGYTLALYEGLLVGEFDFAIITGPLPEERFETIILRWFEPELILPATSPLARHKAISPALLRSCSVASFRRKRHPALFDELIQPLAKLGATIYYPPDQSPGGALAYASQNEMVIPVAFPMHSDEQVRSHGMVRRKICGREPIAALQLARARGVSTARRDRLWSLATALTQETGAFPSVGRPGASAASMDPAESRME